MIPWPLLVIGFCFACGLLCLLCVTVNYVRWERAQRAARQERIAMSAFEREAQAGLDEIPTLHYGYPTFKERP
jgi:hypothetical protein